MVAEGYSQRLGIDYEETYSPVVRMESIRVLLSIVAEGDLKMVHFDVKTAFLEGSLEEKIYMQQPEGFEQGWGKLTRSLYGLKQAPCAWNQCFTEFLRKFNLEPLQLHSDNCIFVKRGKDKAAKLIIAIYVDDELVCSSRKDESQAVLDHLSRKFEITVVDAKRFLGFEIKRIRLEKSLFISQTYYIKKVLERFGMSDAKPASTPADPSVRLCRSGTRDNP